MHVLYFSHRKIPLVSVSCLGAQVLIQRWGWKLRTLMSQLFVVPMHFSVFVIIFIIKLGVEKVLSYRFLCLFHSA